MSRNVGASSKQLESGRRRNVNPLPTRFAPIHVHEDEVPSIAPIPFKLDEEEDVFKTQETPKQLEKRNCMKLDDLPNIYHTHSLSEFSTHVKCNFSTKKPKVSTSAVTKPAQIHVLGDEDEGRSVYCMSIPKYKSLDRLHRTMKKKSTDYIYKKAEIKMVIHGTAISLTRSVTSIKKAMIQGYTGKRAQDDPETYPWRAITHTFNWINSFDLSAPKVSEILEAWKAAAKSSVSSSTKIRTIDRRISKVAQKIGVPQSKLSKFSFLTLDDSLQKFSKNKLIPDMFKMMAFGAWQAGNLPQCLFYLSEAHTFHSKREIMDKHASYFARKFEYCRSPQRNNPVEEKKCDLFQKLSKELSGFSKTQSCFESNVNKLNPEWNVVQLTNLFYTKNRFGMDLKRKLETPALFISALVNVNGVRRSFLTYQSAPKENQAISKMGVIESLKLLMLRNRKLNEQFRGKRTNYWELRAKHNASLKTLLDSIEENWIFPWEFLLPGNISEPSVVKSITLLLTSLEATTRIPFTPAIKAVLYKLVENYNILRKVVKDNLAGFLGVLLDAHRKEMVVIATAVAKCGTKIDLSRYPRSPTILVLDQELDLIPWESLPCLRSTPVTRVPSIPLIGAITRISEVKKSKYKQVINPDSCGYLLNPDGTLKGVEDRLTGYLKGNLKWTGAINRKVPTEEMETYFQSKDIYLYCGHGSGSYFFPEHRLQRVDCRAIPLLMGCGSLKYKHYGPRSAPASYVTALLASTCLSAVGFLYEITDLECDRVTIELLERWAPGAKGNLPSIQHFDPNAHRTVEKCLPTAIRLSRCGAMHFMTEAALVCYGIPIRRGDE